MARSVSDTINGSIEEAHVRSRVAISVLAALVVVGTVSGSPARAAEEVRAAQMADLAPDHWAYQSVKALIEKYRIMGGYPDRTFRGLKPVSRYELAATLAGLLERVALREDRGIPVNPQDARAFDKLKGEFAAELLDLNRRTVALEGRVSALEGAVQGIRDRATGSGGSNVHGNLNFTLQDDPEDKLRPYIVSSFGVRFEGVIDQNSTVTASLSGGRAANQTGGTPVFTRGTSRDAQKDRGLPTGDVTLDSSAQIATKLPGLGETQVKVGHVSPGAFIGLGGLAHHYGDGLIGSGLGSVSGNSVRTGVGDIGLGARLKGAGWNTGLGLNSQFVFIGGGLDLAGLGDFRAIGDIDHNSFGSAQLEGYPTWRLASSMNLGSDQLGVSLQGGVTSAANKMTPRAGLNVITTLAGIEWCLGAAYRTDPDLTVQEIVPTGYAFVPARDWVPSILLAFKEPQTLSSPKSTGPGSLLGTKAGWTLQLGLANPIFPNLVFELNQQSNVLFSGEYDAIGYALSTSAEF